MAEAFPKWIESLDPDEPLGKPYNFKFQLPVGDSLTAAQIDPIDGASNVVSVSPLIAITEVAFALISGQLWGVSFRARGLGTTGTQCVRCRFATALGNGDDDTYRMIVKQR